MKISYGCKRLVELIFTLFLWMVLVPVIAFPLAFVWIPLIIVRYLEQVVYERVFHMKRLPSDDILWLMDSSNSLSLVNGMIVTESCMSTERIQRLVQRKKIDASNEKGSKKYPNATKYIHAGYLNFYWAEEKSFDIREHVYEWDDTTYNSKTELMNVINQIAPRPFVHRNKLSPWEYIVFHFVDGVTTKTCILIRCHHAFTDGVSMINYIVNNLSDNVSIQVESQTVSNAYLLKKLKGYFYMPLTFFNILFIPYPAHSLHHSAVTGEKILRYSQPINLKLIKAIKNKLKITVNDVLTGCLATIMHQYFKEHSTSIPKDIVALFPFDTRYSLAEAETFANKFAIVFVPLPSGCGDPLMNMVEMNRRMTAFKLSGDFHGMRTGVRLLLYTMPSSVSSYILNLLASHSSMVISNVPGPQLPISLDGTPVEMMCFWPPAKENVTISTSFLSYRGEIRSALAIDAISQTSPEEILKGYNDIFYSLAKKLELVDFISE